MWKIRSQRRRKTLMTARRTSCLRNCSRWRNALATIRKIIREHRERGWQRFFSRDEKMHRNLERSAGKLSKRTFATTPALAAQSGRRYWLLAARNILAKSWLRANIKPRCNKNSKEKIREKRRKAFVPVFFDKSLHDIFRKFEAEKKIKGQNYMCSRRNYRANGIFSYKLSRGLL